MKKKILLFLILACSMAGVYSSNPFKKIAKGAVENAKSDSLGGGLKNYDKLLKDAASKKGMFTTHFTKKNKLYFELSDSAMQHVYLLTNRIASTSNTQDFVAGEMATRPLVVRFSKDSVNVYMHKVQTSNEVEEGSSIASSFEKNFFHPVLKGFPIEARNGKNVVIDVTPFFAENERSISPIKPDSPLSKLLGGSSNLKGTFVAGASGLQEVKTFQQNIEVKSMLSYTTQPLYEPYTVIVNRSLVLLPDTVMPMRLQDNRVGYFSSDRSLFTTQADKVVPYSFIHRWRLAPKSEDREAYFRGELVEPARPIVFYVDSAFPQKWISAVKQGVEDWNRAFEAAGFKNAIKAKDYPKNDPEFDPDDIRYSCIKYATTRTANAMGPSHTDPRSGEILCADVIWYHNIVSLLHNWRFTQTAAVDARVRKPVFDDEVMRESMRYVAAHEIGHTLGLMHNMGASYSYPVDSLRSPSFTQRYGTTPSIMDYARNNFVAQPGDFEKGVKLTPPVLGVYDIHAINWGYRLIPGVDKPEEEKNFLSRWIEEKANDPMYEFGAQQFFGLIDPTDQTEDLGDDHIRSGNLAISNLKILMQHLEAWTLEEGERYDNVENMYAEVLKQYTRHVRHVLPYIGGVVFKEIRQGEPSSVVAKRYVDKKTQKEALVWLLGQMRSFNAWLTPPALIAKMEVQPEVGDKLQKSIVSSLFNTSALYRIQEGEKIDPANNYRLNDYLDDVITEVFKASYKGQALNTDEITIQSAAIAQLISGSGLKKAEAKAKVSIAEDEAYLLLADTEPLLPCGHSALEHATASTSFLRINFGLPVLPAPLVNALATAQLKKIARLYRQQRASTSDSLTRSYYDYQLLTIDKLFNE